MPFIFFFFSIHSMANDINNFYLSVEESLCSKCITFLYCTFSYGLRFSIHFRFPFWSVRPFHFVSFSLLTEWIQSFKFFSCHFNRNRVKITCWFIPSTRTKKPNKYVKNKYIFFEQIELINFIFDAVSIRFNAIPGMCEGWLS